MKRFLSKVLKKDLVEKGVRESGQSRTSNIVADYVESFNDDNDMQIRCTEGIFLHPMKKSF